MAPIETRDKARKPVESSAEFTINESTEKTIKLTISKSEAIKASLLDISTSGCGLDSPYLIPPGVVLDIKINAGALASELGSARIDPLKVGGCVRSCIMKTQGHYRLGIKFSKIEEEDRKLIEQFIASKERRAAPRWPMQ